MERALHAFGHEECKLATSTSSHGKPKGTPMNIHAMRSAGPSEMFFWNNEGSALTCTNVCASPSTSSSPPPRASSSFERLVHFRKGRSARLNCAAFRNPSCATIKDELLLTAQTSQSKSPNQWELSRKLSNITFKIAQEGKDQGKRIRRQVKGNSSGERAGEKTRKRMTETRK